MVRKVCQKDKIVQLKYHTISEIRQTEKYQELWNAYKANPTKFTMWSVIEYLYDEMEFCKEVIDQVEAEFVHKINQMVDVKDITLGDEAKWTMKCDTERNLKSTG